MVRNGGEGEDGQIVKSLCMTDRLTIAYLCVCLSFNLVVCVCVLSVAWVLRASVWILYCVVCVCTCYQSPTQTYIHTLFVSREFQSKWNNVKIRNCSFLQFWWCLRNIKKMKRKKEIISCDIQYLYHTSNYVRAYVPWYSFLFFSLSAMRIT